MRSVAEAVPKLSLIKNSALEESWQPERLSENHPAKSKYISGSGSRTDASCLVLGWAGIVSPDSRLALI